MLLHRQKKIAFNATRVFTMHNYLRLVKRAEADLGGGGPGGPDPPPPFIPNMNETTGYPEIKL